MYPKTQSLKKKNSLIFLQCGKGRPETQKTNL